MVESGEETLWFELAPGVLARVDAPVPRARGGARPGGVARGSPPGAAGPTAGSGGAAPPVALRGVARGSPRGSAGTGRWARARWRRGDAGRARVPRLRVPGRVLALLAVVVLTVSVGIGVSARPAGSPGGALGPGWGDTSDATAAGSAGPASDPTAAGSAGSAPDANAAGAGEPDWWALLAELDAARTAALVARDPGAVAGYAVPDSAAWRADTDLIAELRRLALAPQGLATRLVAVEEVRRESGGAAVVTLVDQRSAYGLLDPQGRTVAQVPASGSRRWQVDLVGPAAGSDRWRIREVRAVP